MQDRKADRRRINFFMLCCFFEAKVRTKSGIRGLFGLKNDSSSIKFLYCNVFIIRRLRCEEKIFFVDIA
ncbi:MAG: hypothetical protein K2K37_03265, partial [Muribaculaceae bacterium]|nr:hypothetical protein [Muribaculaceae bacterium]